MTQRAAASRQACPHTVKEALVLKTSRSNVRGCFTNISHVQRRSLELGEDTRARLLPGLMKAASREAAGASAEHLELSLHCCHPPSIIPPEFLPGSFSVAAPPFLYWLINQLHSGWPDLSRAAVFVTHPGLPA